MLEISILVGVIVIICVLVWMVLRPKNIRDKKIKSSKAGGPGEKRVSNVPSNRDLKIEGIGESIINSSDRRKKR